MEFLVPTLQVVKELKWKENDFSDRIDALEKLREDRLKAIIGIYAEKRRQKQWYDIKVRSKHIQPRDLVLFYKLKKNKKKLNKQGLGLFVINELSSSGLVRL